MNSYVLHDVTFRDPITETATAGCSLFFAQRRMRSGRSPMGSCKWRNRIQNVGTEALAAVRRVQSTAGLTEDQVQAVQNEILEGFKKVPVN